MRFFFLLQIAVALISQSACADNSRPLPVRASPDPTPLTDRPNTDGFPAFTRNADCTDFINETPQHVSCGFIVLPVDHNNPASGTVTLPILIAGKTRTQTTDHSNKAILIPGGGGPGASIGFGLDYQPNEYLGIYGNLRAAGFDLVILDQRGAGLSKPALRCAETADAFIESISDKQSLAASLESYRASLNTCHDRLSSSNIPLQHFDTYQSAKDYLSVIEQLPYKQWGVLATSYATVIAQEMERQQPGVFYRIVLDSPVSVDFQKPFTYELTRTALERVISHCTILDRCNRRYSQLATRFNELLQRLKSEPIDLSVYSYNEDSRTERTTLRVDDTTLLDMLIISAYSNLSIANIPWIIDGVYQGKTARLQELATNYWLYNTDTDFANALSWTIHCKERQPMELAYLQANPHSHRSYSGNSKIALDKERMICADWNMKTAEISAASQRKTQAASPAIATKTLIISGDLDPVIDRDDVANTADDFTTEVLSIVPGTGHSVWFQSHCTRINVMTFFLTGSDTRIRDCSDGISRFR